MARTRSEAIHRRILEAAVGLFSERGIEATSMDSISEASGASKATIYKHWQDKEALCLEVMGYIYGHDTLRPVFHSDDYRADLIATLEYQPVPERRSLRERMLPHLIAYASRDKGFGMTWRQQSLAPIRKAVSDLLQRGQREGVLRPGFDPGIGIALLLGPLVYRNIFLKQDGHPAPAKLEEQVADTFLRAWSVVEPIESPPRAGRRTRRKQAKSTKGIR